MWGLWRFLSVGPSFKAFPDLAAQIAIAHAIVTLVVVGLFEILDPFRILSLTHSSPFSKTELMVAFMARKFQAWF